MSRDLAFHVGERMNFARIALAAVAAWIVSLPVGYVINDFLLADIYEANRSALRSSADVTANLPLGFAFVLVGFFAFAYAYAKGYRSEERRVGKERRSGG